jgi:hydrogenase maturation factor
MTSSHFLPLGKLPAPLLEQLISKAPISDSRVLLGPGIGLDCAVIDIGHSLLVFKSDPITFASDEIGWYCVQVCANDIATTGAEPRWMLTTLLLPEDSATETQVTEITNQIYRACQSMDISLVGGHTEVTHGIDHPILMGTMIGEVDHDQLITPQGAGFGDSILLTKGVPIEAAAILAREFPHLLNTLLTPDELRTAADMLYLPGIGITRDARIARDTGHVTAMHDPTEGGLAAALWELAQASGTTLIIRRDAIPIPDLAGRICAHFQLDPLAAIASGALLMTVSSADTEAVCGRLHAEGIACSEIGRISCGPGGVLEELKTGECVPLARPERDEIARFFEEHSSDPPMP